MTNLRTIVTVDENRQIQLPEGVAFQAGETLHVLWDGNTLQISRRKPKRLSDAFAQVQEQAGQALDMDGLQARLRRQQERNRRRFDDALGQWFKDND